MYYYIFRQIFCLTDEWYGMTMDEIREFEEKTKDELDKVHRSYFF